MKIIENKNGIATGKIYNIGNPENNWSIKELAEKMLALAGEYPEYQKYASQVKIIDTTADNYYGKGYQDVKNRVPYIKNTQKELSWEPKISMDDSLRKILTVIATRLKRRVLLLMSAFKHERTKPSQRILFSLTYHPFVGGAEVAIKEVTDRISPKEYSFDMITLRFDKDLPKFERFGNIDIFRVGMVKRGG